MNQASSRSVRTRARVVNEESSSDHHQDHEMVSSVHIPWTLFRRQTDQHQNEQKKKQRTLETVHVPIKRVFSVDFNTSSLNTQTFFLFYLKRRSIKLTFSSRSATFSHFFTSHPFACYRFCSSDSGSLSLTSDNTRSNAPSLILLKLYLHIDWYLFAPHVKSPRKDPSKLKWLSLPLTLSVSSLH